MVKECKPGQVRNPASGRCVDKDGPTGRKLRGLQALPKFGPKPAPKSTQKACPAGKVRNPRTGRCVAAMTLCHKMNGVNPAKFGNAVAAQCRNALTKKIAGVPARLPNKAAGKKKLMSTGDMIASWQRLRVPNNKGDAAAMATVKRVAGVVNPMALRGYKAVNLTLKWKEKARLRAMGFKIKAGDYETAEIATLSKDGVEIEVEASERGMALTVGRKGSKNAVTAVWALNNLEVDILRSNNWPAAAKVLRATLTRKLNR